jgi:hypothetical protein
MFIFDVTRRTLSNDSKSNKLKNRIGQLNTINSRIVYRLYFKAVYRYNLQDVDFLEDLNSKENKLVENYIKANLPKRFHDNNKEISKLEKEMERL